MLMKSTPGKHVKLAARLNSPQMTYFNLNKKTTYWQFDNKITQKVEIV